MTDIQSKLTSKSKEQEDVTYKHEKNQQQNRPRVDRDDAISKQGH